ncbi:MAG TPA: amidase [Anaerolineales bacterium]|jgi:Asp-tRNA(Asn)/Glu-tRNA(Gln) amidotransferase A subunit family amidase
MKTRAMLDDLFERLQTAEARFAAEEPRVHAFLPEPERFTRLRAEADALVDRFPNAAERPPLFGLLVGVKDMFQVEGFVTQAGSRLPAEVLQGAQAVSVTRLKTAGALMLGKTVTTEFAYFSPGPTRNPHALEHTPGGSSSGSAAAVAAGMSALALGTQTIGSIIRPAAFCGVFGLKPTYDRISKAGVIPLSPSLDHVGFFAPDVFTALRVAPVIYNEWDGAIPARTKPILGIPEGPYLDAASDDARACFATNCRVLSDAGYELRHIPAMPDSAEIRARHDLIMSAEAARVHAGWFAKYAELYAPKTAQLIRRGQAISDAQLAQASAQRDAWRDEISALMESNSIDLWIAPSTIGPAPRGLESTGDPIMNLPWTQAGFPAVNLPAGKSQGGLPLGLQVIGGWSRDEALLHWAIDLERVVRLP